MVNQVVSVINLNEIRKSVGDFVSVRAAEFVAAEFEMLLSRGEDGHYGFDTLGWLYDNDDFSDEVSDPQSLDDLYTTMADTMSVAVFEIHHRDDYKTAKEYIMEHIANLEDVIIDAREERIMITMDVYKDKTETK